MTKDVELEFAIRALWEAAISHAQVVTGEGVTDDDDAISGASSVDMVKAVTAYLTDII